MRTIRELRLDGFLSFPPDSAAFELHALNVLIGPNGSGKSNLIEALELLSSTPRDLAATVRDGGGPAEWLWKGGSRPESAQIEAVLSDGTPTGRPLRYRLVFTPVQSRLEIVDESIEELEPEPGKPDVYFYYRFQRGYPVLNIKDPVGEIFQRRLQRQDLLPDQSVLAQRKDPMSTLKSRGRARRSGPSAPFANGRSAAMFRFASHNQPTFRKTACSRITATWPWF